MGGVERRRSQPAETTLYLLEFWVHTRTAMRSLPFPLSAISNGPNAIQLPAGAARGLSLQLYYVPEPINSNFNAISSISPLSPWQKQGKPCSIRVLLTQIELQRCEKERDQWLFIQKVWMSSILGF